MDWKYRAGLGLLLCVWAQAQDLPAVRTLTAAGSFAIPGSASLRLSVAQSSGASMWFLLSGKNYNEAVRTDSLGLKQMSFALPSPAGSPISAVCTSEGGRFAVVHYSGQIDVYSSAGALSDTFEAVKDRHGCVFDGEALLGIGSSGLTPLEGSAGKPLAVGEFALSPNTFFARDHHIVAIDPADAVTHVLDTDRGELQTAPLRAPEIQGFVRPAHMKSYEVPVLAYAAQDAIQGDIYAVVNGVNFSKGVTVLKFDEQGRLTGRLRCVIPNSAAWVTTKNRDGHFQGGNIAVVDGKLLWISPAQKQVVYFALN